ncbi:MULTISPECIES: twin-arginine translocase subunit TatC [unclassified Corallococcus]|uniref:twin-arginine translocase subunit TatC n=1 Tax=unclassified Corallococcus TaxID=2685029 RepID=UPI001A8C926E|nr:MULTISPECIES: twin-arginine translocase subunit TatC [unclassified Corallococcus]MBN9682998.1 twin-arginine translocase subunit TatC [Corallococcus sp. NCSPR001]WAS85466.1 twin-arginine translocase subunit TatC [Corallococcus sp. NCRR]
MSLAEHLTELRSRLVKCSLAVLVLGAVSLIFAKPIFGVLMRPVLDALPPEGRSLVYTSGIEEINVLMKVGVYCGIFLTTPVILWQIWGFVAPGLYPEERKYASPFVVLGSVAFIVGSLFCYFLVLPSMFKFLLNEEETLALEQRMDTARMGGEDALRFLRIGEVERAGHVAKETSAALTAAGEGQVKDPEVATAKSVELTARLKGLGELLDAAADGLGVPARGVLRQAVEKRVEAVTAFGKQDYVASEAAMDQAASLLAGVAPTRAEEMSGLWRLQKELARGYAEAEAARWTRPMLTMNEQLSLVLLLILAFGVIFELPLVMALLGIVGVVKSGFLIRYQRHAFVVCLIAAAVLTPTGDVVNLSLMAGPMLLCYELGVLAVWLIEKRRAKAEASTDITPAA